MNDPKQETAWKSGVSKGLFFVIFAVPGALIAVFSGIFLIASFFEPKERVPSNPAILFGALVAGTFMTLLGLGKIRQWLYGLVFLSMPLSLWLYALINPTAIGGTFPFLGVIVLSAYGTFVLVKRHYSKRN
ncbi:MAG: hypothetical protein HOP17_05690 [Acidobacteria bacterium]|nr:hypothetical protein [Acidobacteriota bacterium]